MLRKNSNMDISFVQEGSDTFKTWSIFGRRKLIDSPSSRDVCSGSFNSQESVESPPRKRRKTEGATSILTTPGGSSAATLKRYSSEALADIADSFCQMKKRLMSGETDRDISQDNDRLEEWTEIIITPEKIKKFKGRRKEFPALSTAKGVKSADIYYTEKTGERPVSKNEFCHAYAYMFGGMDGVNPNAANNLYIGSAYTNTEMLTIEEIIKSLVIKAVVPYVKLQVSLLLKGTTDILKCIEMKFTLPLFKDSDEALVLTETIYGQSSKKPSVTEVEKRYQQIKKRYELEKKRVRAAKQHVVETPELPKPKILVVQKDNEQTLPKPLPVNLFMLGKRGRCEQMQSVPQNLSPSISCR